MSQSETKQVGFIIGRERDFPNAIMKRINENYDDIRADLVKMGGTMQDTPLPYNVIIDRMSHEVPYYRSYVKYAAMRGCYLINNPFTWSIDTKFLSGALVQKLGYKSPRTVVLPNKDIEAETVPDSFRNLEYPMDWQGIIDYIGSPAIFKDVNSGGRRFAYRVNNVDELIQRYDESGTRTMILQQVLDTDNHVHCMVIGGELTHMMSYSFDERQYHDCTLDLDGPIAQQITEMALTLTNLYGYDINLPEFVVQDGEVYVINATNPSPLINHELMTDTQFDWIIDAVTDLAVSSIREPKEQRNPFDLD
ncbi:MAG: hypothetical protein R3C44_07665 [Chloroflexota bacterium]